MWTQKRRIDVPHPLASPELLDWLKPRVVALGVICIPVSLLARRAVGVQIAAGKSTVARRLAERPATLLITMDDWMSILFPTENRTIEDFARLSARLRAAMGPHVVDILRQNLSVVLDFPANTVMWRNWMQSLISEARVAHELHVLDFPDAICKERLRQRNEGVCTRTG